MSKERPVTQALPEHHEIVKWANGTLPGRCGQLASGDISTGYCGNWFNFRACYIGSSLIHARVCNECAIKADIMAADIAGRRQMFAKELAGLKHISAEQAKREAFEQFKNASWISKFWNAKKKESEQMATRSDWTDTD